MDLFPIILSRGATWREVTEKCQSNNQTYQQIIKFYTAYHLLSQRRTKTTKNRWKTRSGLFPDCKLEHEHIVDISEWTARLKTE